MALTREVLVANAALTGLSEEQIAAITTLSQNDETQVIGAKVGEIYGGLDADILEVSGVAKNGTEKTYDYAKRVIGDIKAQANNATALQGQIDGLTKEKTRLEKVIADGATDPETAKALKQAKADLANITGQYNELNDKYNAAGADHAKAIFNIKVENALSSAAVGLKFKAGLPESVTQVITQQVTERIKGMNPEMIDDGKGGQIMAFKDANGAIMRNASNQLNPYTPQELFVAEMEKMGVLDKGRQQQGGGTNPPAGGGAGGGTIDVAGAKTRVEAHDAISQSLLSQGMTVGSKQYDDAMSQAWKDNNVAALPEK